jgi:hypothetical protein
MGGSDLMLVFMDGFGVWIIAHVVGANDWNLIIKLIIDEVK